MMPAEMSTNVIADLANQLAVEADLLQAAGDPFGTELTEWLAGKAEPKVTATSLVGRVLLIGVSPSADYDARFRVSLILVQLRDLIGRN